MKLTPISTKTARANLRKAESRTKRLVLICAKAPKAVEIHEARISVRKLKASISIMPSGYRRDPIVKKRIRALQELYAACAMVRDFDAIQRGLSIIHDQTSSEGMELHLAKQRSLYLKRVVAIAKRLGRFELRPPPELKKREITKRLNKLAARLIGEIKALYDVVAQSEKEVTSLHALRKRCRELMYLLEYTKQRKSTKSAWQKLEEARQELGSIRDDDMVLEYLKGEQAQQELCSKVSNSRSIKYHKFFSRRNESVGPRLLVAIREL